MRLAMSSAFSTSPDAQQHRPRQWEKWVLYAYLRMQGLTQKAAGSAVGRAKRTVAEWEEDKALYAQAREEARQRWLSDVSDAARTTLLKALQGDAGDLALKVLERIDPDLAPAAQRLKHEGQIDLVAHPAWLTLRMQILQVLAPYPEARAQLAEMLSDGDGNSPGH
jgi:hypothetical protein